MVHNGNDSRNYGNGKRYEFHQRVYRGNMASDVTNPTGNCGAVGDFCVIHFNKPIVVVYKILQINLI